MANPKHGVTTPDVVLTLTLDTAFPTVEVMSVDGVGVVWVTFDGSAPAAGQDGCVVLPASAGAKTLVHPKQKPSVIKFFSTAAVRVSARGV